MSTVPERYRVLTYERLKEVLHYFPSTGAFTSIETGRKVGIGGKLSIDGFIYDTGEIAAFYYWGYLPVDCVNYKDGNLLNCSIYNLMLHPRPAMPDNFMELEGVSFSINYRKWYCWYKKKHLGFFSSQEEAKIHRDQYIARRKRAAEILKSRRRKSDRSGVMRKSDRNAIVAKIAPVQVEI